LNGFVAEDDFVPFIRNKFNNLNFLLILNDGQKKLLRNKNLIIKNKIHKCYLGTEIQNHYNVGNSKKEITFLSCGSLIDIKNPYLTDNSTIKWALPDTTNILFNLNWPNTFDFDLEIKKDIIDHALKLPFNYGINMLWIENKKLVKKIFKCFTILKWNVI
jgi:hypothetical protein